MKSRRALRPTISDHTLEPRMVLSHVSAHVAALQQAAQQWAAGGYGRTVTQTSTLPGAPTTLTMAGHGVVPGVSRHALVSGTLTENGSLSPEFNGVSGTLTLTDRRGSLTVAISGQNINLKPLQATTTDLAYSVVGGTGAYANFTSSGTLSLRLQAAIVGNPDNFSVVPGHFHFKAFPGEVPVTPPPSE